MWWLMLMLVVRLLLLLLILLLCCWFVGWFVVLIVDALELLARRASGVSPTHQKFLKEKYLKTKQ